MNKSIVYDIIRSPLVTEKSTDLAEISKYVFKVDNKANKSKIKKAIEEIFNVKVLHVNTINIKGKVKVFKGRYGKRNNFKKAIVSVESGRTIDLSTGV